MTPHHTTYEILGSAPAFVKRQNNMAVDLCVERISVKNKIKNKNKNWSQGIHEGINTIYSFSVMHCQTSPGSGIVKPRVYNI